MIEPFIGGLIIYYDYRGNRMATVVPNGRADVILLDINNNPEYTFHSSDNAKFDSSFDPDHVLTSLGMDVHAVGFTDYDYDGNGNLDRITDANSNEKTFGYDAVGNLAWAKYGRGYQTSYNYDEHSRLIHVINDSLGYEVNYVYDERDNLIQEAIQAGTVDYIYNGKNQLTSITTGDPGVRHTTSYTYDAKRQIKTVTDPDGVVTEYTYDLRGNLAQTKHDGIVRFDYQYDGLNRLTATYYNGTAGGGKAAVVPISPAGAQQLSGDITITWKVIGDWSSGSGDVTIQYSINGVDWFDIATVSATDGLYVWNPGGLVIDTLQIRFTRPGDPDFRLAQTAAFAVQPGVNCYLDRTHQLFSSSGGTGMVNITGGGGCIWTAVSNDSWITITSGSSGTGSGTVSYTVSENTSPNPRVGSMTIAGVTFQVEQAGNQQIATGAEHSIAVKTDGTLWAWGHNIYGQLGNGTTTDRHSPFAVFSICSFVISPLNELFTSSGGSNLVNVTTQEGCLWTAVSNDSWITITWGASSSENGTIYYDVSANASPLPRTATVTIAGETFTVDQSGVTVPDVVGMSQVDAETAITGAGLTVGTVTTAFDNAIAAGNIISSYPIAGTSVAPGTPVDLVVSTGLCPPTCEGDFDCDGDVDVTDLAVFAADFGRTDCPSCS